MKQKFWKYGIPLMELFTMAGIMAIILTMPAWSGEFVLDGDSKDSKQTKVLLKHNSRIMALEANSEEWRSFWKNYANGVAESDQALHKRLKGFQERDQKQETDLKKLTEVVNKLQFRVDKLDGLPNQ